MCLRLFILLSFVAVISCADENVSTKTTQDFLAITVATNQTDGFRRLMRSARVNNVPYTVLGMGEEWKGGKVEKYAGGGQKVQLLKAELEKYKDDASKIVLFTDGYDVIIISNADDIVSQFEKMNCRVLFSAEGFCWPDESLASEYPPVMRGKRYLNSGLFIGYAPELYGIVSKWDLQDKDDDQLFYTKIYLDEDLRKAYKIKLDHKSEVFQNLHGAQADVELRFKGKKAYLQNTAYNTVPLVVHGNGLSKEVLSMLGNYIAEGWNEEDGCTSCWEDMINLDNLKEEENPSVLIAVFVEQSTPFIEEFFDKIAALDYSKKRIDLFIHNTAEFHVKDVEKFVEEHGKTYRSLKQITPADNIKEWHARNLAVDECVKRKCDYLFAVDAIAHLDNPFTLKLLMEQNRTIIAPMLVRMYKAWSNFWGAVTSEGFYARSMDYMAIVKNERRGLWNVPYIAGCYLINATSVINNKLTRPNYINGLQDADMAFCNNNRERGLFMYVTNRVDWGHLINADSYDTSHLHNELYQVFDNRWDWEARYLHENYADNLNASIAIDQPCPDVYRFPMFKTRYCDEFVAEMEHFGKWSDGNNYDPRIAGGYENVPTRDIHMRQVGLHNEWLELLRVYVQPLQARVFLGYHSDPPQAQMNFVVRYHPDEQASLRPHHDSSTYTINVALNNAGVDYEGGGCRFVRYNCSVTDSQKGWMLMHPGRLTHYHEGLKVTKGTRYIMISFIDP